MADTVDKVSERLAELEVTVAQGFHDLRPRFQSIDQSFEQVDQRFEQVNQRFKQVDQRFDQIDQRLNDLEHHVDERFHEAELRDLALSQKIDVNTESLRSDLTTVLKAVDSLADEMRRGFDSIRKGHAADREVLTVTLQQHARRLNDLEIR